MDRLPAAAAVALGGPDDAEALAAAVGPDGIHVIIDYLRGPPTEVAAVTRRGLAPAAPRVRLGVVGRMAGPAIALPADVLLSSGLEVLDSGPGTIPLTEIISAIPQFMGPSLPPATCRSTSARCPSPRSSRPGVVAAAAGGSSCGPDHRPAHGADGPP